MEIKQVLSRFYVNEMDASIEFYEALFQQSCCLRFRHDRFGIELAQVGNALILAGTEDALEPFVKTKVTFLVDSIVEFRKFLLENGAVIIRDITNVPTGINMTVEHADGTVAEYVEFKSNAPG